MFKPRRARLAPATLLLTATAVGISGCFATSFETDPTTTTAKPTTTTLVPRGLLSRIDQILPGQCFDPLPSSDQRPFAVLAIPCEEPHRNEIFDRISYRAEDGKPAPRGALFPGEAVVRTMAEQACYSRFQTWMGIAWTESDFDIETWFPSAASWAGGDRTITCTAMEFRGRPTEGSVRGTGR
ncbi:MAG: septum formation family protein [Microthrixaceae bacterium]|nr:septum formation family protein [Microthrixaceae bacterium]